MNHRKKVVVSIIVQIVLFLVLTLPFHYVLSEPAVFIKKSPSFERTFVTREQVERILEEYYLYSNDIEKHEAEDDPLIRELTDRWRVYKFGEKVIFEKRGE